MSRSTPKGGIQQWADEIGTEIGSKIRSKAGSKIGSKIGAGTGTEFGKRKKTWKQKKEVKDFIKVEENDRVGSWDQHNIMFV